MDATHEWILCLRPNESLSDDLEAALLEWKDRQPDECAKCYKIPVREENGGRLGKSVPRKFACSIAT